MNIFVIVLEVQSEKCPKLIYNLDQWSDFDTEILSKLKKSNIPIQKLYRIALFQCFPTFYNSRNLWNDF